MTILNTDKNNKNNNSHLSVRFKRRYQDKKRIWPLDDEPGDPTDDVLLAEKEEGTGPLPMRDDVSLFLGHAGWGPQSRLSIAGRLRARIRGWGGGGAALAGYLLFRSAAERCQPAKKPKQNERFSHRELTTANSL